MHFGGNSYLSVRAKPSGKRLAGVKPPKTHFKGAILR